jgi:xylose isomerase
MEKRYSAELGNVGQFAERYMACGYNREYSIEEMFDRLKSIKRISGVELVSNWHITKDNVEEMKKLAGDRGLTIVSILPDNFAKRVWGWGAFCSKDKEVRRRAVTETKEMMDIMESLGGHMLTIWNGQDGYDYPFCQDYVQEVDWIIEGIKECCRHRKDIRLAIEYKLKEPRVQRSYASNAFSTLMMVKEIDEDNCGITLDFGHSLNCGENPAEIAAMLNRYGKKLFHVHLNDNHGVWDDDCIAGSLHTIQFIEFFYWLNRIGYDGWFSYDQYTFREDGRDALEEGIGWMDDINTLVDKLIAGGKVEDLFKSGSAVEMSRTIRNLIMRR